jgi:hypothetical protein
MDSFGLKQFASHSGECAVTCLEKGDLSTAPGIKCVHRFDSSHWLDSCPTGWNAIRHRRCPGTVTPRP